MSADSVSELVMRANVLGRGELIGKLYKHLSPVTLTKIQRSIPITGRVNWYETNFVYILTSVTTGEEKSRKEFKRGDIAFMPSGSMICFFLKDTRSYKPMNLLGTISQGMEVLDSCRRGESIDIRTLA